jgi:hypothetical protein
MPASNLVEARWVAERRGPERFRTEQPPYSILNRSIEREVLPAPQQYGMGILAWAPLGQGMLTGRVRRGQDNDVTCAKFFTAFSDERRLDAVERLIPLAEEADCRCPTSRWRSRFRLREQRPDHRPRLVRDHITRYDTKTRRTHTDEPLATRPSPSHDARPG